MHLEYVHEAQARLVQCDQSSEEISHRIESITYNKHTFMHTVYMTCR